MVRSDGSSRAEVLLPRMASQMLLPSELGIHGICGMLFLTLGVEMRHKEEDSPLGMEGPDHLEPYRSQSTP